MNYTIIYFCITITLTSAICRFFYPELKLKYIFLIVTAVLLSYLYLGDPKIINYLQSNKVRDQLTQWQQIRSTVFELQNRALELNWHINQNKTSPDLSHIHELGNIYRLQGKLDLALDLLSQAIALSHAQNQDLNLLNQDYLQCLNQLAIRAYSQKKFELAKSFWLKMQSYIAINNIKLPSETLSDLETLISAS